MPTPLPFEDFVSILSSCWDETTSFTPDEWTVANPARGQCLVSALLVQDYYGGDLKRYRVKGKRFEETHYCNLLYDGMLLIDTTVSQYTVPVLLAASVIELQDHSTARERYLADAQTKERYEILKERIKRALRQ